MSETRKIASIFKDDYYRIPDYQRGYAWKEKQLLDLWDDLQEIKPDEKGNFKTHYTGTLYLESAEPEETEKWIYPANFYNVVDGQQRLTTISILLHTLISLSPDSGLGNMTKEELIKTFISTKNIREKSALSVYKFSYSRNNQNYNYLLHEIFGEKSIPFNSKDGENIYAKNLFYAKMFFTERISSLSVEEKEILYKKIIGSLEFDVRKIEKDLDVQAVFETLNNRGKPLSVLEKLKNRLIYLNSKLDFSISDGNNLRKTINEVWGNIYKSLGMEGENPLDEDEFLSAHLSLYRKPLKYTFSAEGTEKKVFQMFCNNSSRYPLDEKRDEDSIDPNSEMEPEVNFKKINDYVLSLNEFVNSWCNINRKKQDNVLIQKILVLSPTKETKLLLSVIDLKCRDENKKKTILSLICDILFRNRIPGAWCYTEDYFASLAWAVYNGKDEEGFFHFSDLKNELEKAISAPIETSSIVNSIKALYDYQRGNKGFYRWNALKFFLFEYEEKLQKDFKEKKPRVTINDYDDISIEHIMPQKYETYWNLQMNEIISNVEENKRELATTIIINTLGNLTILRKEKNSEVGNDSWKENNPLKSKKERYASGSFNELEISKSNNWSYKEIKKRGEDLIDFLETRIKGLKLTNEQKAAILFYDNRFDKLNLK